MKEQCIIFILKNNEKFLTENIDKLLDLKKEFDLIFVTRPSQDRTSQILNFNNLINIDLSYESGYYEALCAGIEFVKDLKYKSWIEFGECDSVSLSEIEKLNDINKELDFEKSVIFVSTYNKKVKRNKLYIRIFVGRKISDPYSRIKIYNKKTFDYIKNEFDCKMYPQNFLNLIYKAPDYIEVKIKKKRTKTKISKNISKRFYLCIYTIFILPFIKRFGIEKK